MWAPAILPLARTRRLAIVASGTRSARAISAVDRPHSVRRLSATRASSASAGWQHVKISRSWSSRTTESGSGDGSSPNRSMVVASFPDRFASRRRRSRARLRATTVSQARGSSGTPSRGHRSSAATAASCTASSARSRLPSARVREARTRPPSTRIVSASRSGGWISLVPCRARVGPRPNPARRLGSGRPSGSPRRDRRTRSGRSRRAPPWSRRTGRRW